MAKRSSPSTQSNVGIAAYASSHPTFLMLKGRDSMPERQSPLAGVDAAVHAGTAPVHIRLREQSLRQTWQIAGWPDTFPGAVRPLLKGLTVDALPDTRIAAALPDGGSLLRVAPERLIFHDIGAQTAEVVRAHGEDEHLTALDLSHADITLVIEGPAARDVMMRLVAIDVDASAFPARAFARTLLGQIPCLVLCASTQEGGVFSISLGRSYAHSAFNLIGLNARSFGCSVDVAQG